MKFIILLGKSGSGKGTQAILLKTKFHLGHINSGALLRARARRKDFIGNGLAKIMARGALIPTPLVFHLWLHTLEQFRKQKKFHGAIFEGSPRKLYEANMLQETLEFYGWSSNIVVLYIKISDREAMKRLLNRGRHDDEGHAIKNRLVWFRKEVRPVIEFYRKKKELVEINGEQPVEKVFKEIVGKLKRFHA
ncbi:MAG: nucleoside monophosphate kinase [Candidatus Wildermuthbacteria bacterium]|nr:nucleoside monophosphate kinase [Candidatus Wildermuthbacteria bacterium]